MTVRIDRAQKIWYPSGTHRAGGSVLRRTYVRRIRDPTQRVRTGGIVAHKFRFRLHGEDTSITFKGPLDIEVDVRRQAHEFAGMLAAVGPVEALA